MKAFHRSWWCLFPEVFPSEARESPVACLRLTPVLVCGQSELFQHLVMWQDQDHVKSLSFFNVVVLFFFLTSVYKQSIAQRLRVHTWGTLPLISQKSDGTGLAVLRDSCTL